MEAVRRSKIKTHMRWVGRVVAAIFIVATPSLAQMREEKMLVGYGGVGGYQLPLWFGAELKIFDRYGVQARPVLSPAGRMP